MKHQILLDEYRRPMRLAQGSMSEEEFFQFCSSNPQLPLERDSHGNILLLPPTGNESSFRESKMIYHLQAWDERLAKGGYVLSSNGAVTLPNGAVRSPDGAWVSKERFEALSTDDRERFSHIAPDFVAEILSRTDSLQETKKKMEEYIENGVRLGFLIDRFRQTAWVYKIGAEPEEISDFTIVLSGGDVLPGFELPLKDFA